MLNADFLYLKIIIAMQDITMHQMNPIYYKFPVKYVKREHGIDIITKILHHAENI